jgi:hypothetical protein
MGPDLIAIALQVLIEHDLRANARSAVFAMENRYKLFLVRLWQASRFESRFSSAIDAAAIE